MQVVIVQYILIKNKVAPNRYFVIKVLNFPTFFLQIFCLRVQPMYEPYSF